MEMQNNKLMQRMGEVIANNKSDFVDMLDTCNVNFAGTEEAELISCYVSEIPKNEQLKIMSAYLIEQNSASSFSGEIENDEVYKNYNTLYDYWDGSDYSNAAGLIGGLVKGGMDISSKVIEGQQKKKFGASDIAQKQAETKAELIRSVIAQKQAKADAEKALAEAKAKVTKYWIIGGSIIGSLAIIGTLIYFIRKK